MFFILNILKITILANSFRNRSLQVSSPFNIKSDILSNLRTTAEAQEGCIEFLHANLIDIFPTLIPFVFSGRPLVAYQFRHVR
jgi:hypothetical protein